MDAPTFHGIVRSNRSPAELWGNRYIQKAFGVAAANTLGDMDVPLNYVTIKSDRSCRVAELAAGELYGAPDAYFEDLTYMFDVPFRPFDGLASAVPESELVVQDQYGNESCRLDVLTSVVPDSATKDLPPARWGPEITFRAQSLQNLALSVARSLRDVPEASEILSGADPGPMDWGDWDAVSPLLADMVAALDSLETRYRDRQTPFLLQCIWKTERDSPLMASDAMDVFVWSDMAVSRMFLDSMRKGSDGGPTRPNRCAVRMFRMVTEALASMAPDLDGIFEETGYGIPAGKEFMVNGKLAGVMMECDRLHRPALRADRLRELASEGFERRIMPERKLESSIYYAIRGLR